MALFNALVITFFVLLMVVYYVNAHRTREHMMNECTPGSPLMPPLSHPEHAACPLRPHANPDAAASGVGLGEPAFEDVNEFAAPFVKGAAATCAHPKAGARAPLEAASPWDAFEAPNAPVDFVVSPPRTTLPCPRPTSGIGEPACEKNNASWAAYDA